MNQSNLSTNTNLSHRSLTSRDHAIVRPVLTLRVTKKRSTWEFHNEASSGTKSVRVYERKGKGRGPQGPNLDKPLPRRAHVSGDKNYLEIVQDDLRGNKSAKNISEKKTQKKQNCPIQNKRPNEATKKKKKRVT